LVARHSETIGTDSKGMRLTDYLQQRWPHADRVLLRRLVLGGSISVNRSEARLEQRLKPADFLEIEWPPEWTDGPPGPPARRRAPSVGSGTGGGLEVLWEGPAALVVLKPAGVYTVPDRHGKDAGVHGMLESLRPGEDLRIAHRLDRDTSGCLALARGLEAARYLDAAFRDGAVSKEYLALVHGSVARDAFEIRRHLGPDPRRQGYVVTVAEGTKRSRPAWTEVVVEQRFRAYTLVRLFPKTGRGHQLRVHLQSCGHPIVGDTAYGGRPLMLSSFKVGYKARRGVEERPLVGRMFLHAERLVLPAPETVGFDLDGGAADVRAPLPADLRVGLEKLRRFGGGAGRQDRRGLVEGSER